MSTQAQSNNKNIQFILSSTLCFDDNNQFFQDLILFVVSQPCRFCLRLQLKVVGYFPLVQFATVVYRLRLFASIDLIDPAKGRYRIVGLQPNNLLYKFTSKLLNKSSVPSKYRELLSAITLVS